MKFHAEIKVMPHKGLLDPQGKAVGNSMKNIGLPEIDNVRIGKHITFELDASTKTEAEQKADTACRRLLANQVMESYEIIVSEL
jgi:phosphoribosylformylglycinamidine synthase